MVEDTRRVVLELLARDLAKGNLIAFQQNIDGVYRSARRLVVGLAALAGLGGIGYMVKRQMEAIDATAKLSDRIGETTENMVALQYAASLSGMDIQGMSSAIETLQKRLGEAVQGTGEAKNALKALNLPISEMIGLSPWQQIQKISAAMGGVKTQGEKAAITTDLFGRGQAKILSLLQEGPAAFEKCRLESDKLGLSFSRYDASKIEAANDAMTRLRAVFDGLFRQIIIQMAPYIELVATKFVDFATSGEGMGTRVITVFEGLSLAAIEFAGQIQRIPAYFYGISAGIWESDAALRHTMDSLTNLDQLFKKLGLTDRTFAEEEKRSLEIAQEFRRKQVEGLEAALSPNAVTNFYRNLRAQQAEAALQARKMAAISVTPVETAAELNTKTKELIASMERENALLGMNEVERAKELALDKMREAIQKDIEAGIIRSTDLTEQERESVMRLAEEHRALSRDSKQSTIDITRAYAKMYDEMTEKSQASFDARRALLQAEYDDYKEKIKDLTALDEWRRDQIEKLAIEQAKATGTIWEGWAAGIAEMKRELPTIGELGADLAVTFRDGIVGALSDAVFEARNLREALDEVLLSMAKMAFEYSMQQAVKGGMDLMTTAITAGLTGAIGGIFAPAVTPSAPASVAQEAARWGGASAKGNVFGPQGMMRFAQGGVVNRPALFAFQRGIGLMGESGPEAVMPLARDRGGRLGVRAPMGESIADTSVTRGQLNQIIRLLETRQNVNLSAKIVDNRDVITRQQMESREGEQLVMHHVVRNR